jgi:hypothetical protein
MKTGASVRVSHPSLNVTELSKLLPLEPTLAREKGTSLSRSRTAARLEAALWILESPCADTAPLEEHCRWLLDRVLPHVNGFQSLRRSGATIDLFCLQSIDAQQSIVFNGDMIRAMATLGIELSLDLYSVGSSATLALAAGHDRPPACRRC